jgi:nitrous oxidase accessory protein
LQRRHACLPACLIGLALVLGLAFSGAMAGERRVEPGPGALLDAVKMAGAGDILRLAPGVYFGPLVIDQPLTLDGGGEAEIRGNARGSVLTVTVPDVTIRGLRISGSGNSNEDRDSGIKLAPEASRARVIDNRLPGNLIGVDVHGARDVQVLDNIITGRRDKRMNDRGNAIYVWNAPGLLVRGNDIRYGRDGIFVNTSRDGIFRGNRFRDLRFAVHYMYTNDSEVSGNLSVGNHLGYAVMFSDNVTITDNISLNDRDYGVMLNYTNNSEISGNLVRRAKDKCIFVYNAHKNRITSNRLETCGIGIHFTAGSERNQVSANAFVANRTQVKYVASKWVDWGAGGRGNYWSDHGAFDLNGDGIADNGFRPNDAVDRLLWRQPAAGLLLGSPAVQLVRWSQSAFPALVGGGVIDSHPLMEPVSISVPEWGTNHGN